MSLGTVIHEGLTRPARARALVLMGGGARTAYQVGVLGAMAAMLRLHRAPPERFPFHIVVGTSAGALNAAYLAGAASRGLGAFDELRSFWAGLHCGAVYRLDAPWWVRFSRILAAARLWRHARTRGAILDTMPLVDTLHRRISLAGIEASLQSGALDAVAVTASSYTSGTHWTFCHTRADARHEGWNRPGRRAEFQPLTIEHLMASSAIPFLFPATPLWVDGRREYFGDGSMRQISPLSPAIHLGAREVLVIGVGQPERAGLAGAPAGVPGLGAIAGHAMASVFHDTLQADVEQTQRLARTLDELPREVAGVLPYHAIEVLALQPSESLDTLARVHLKLLPAGVQRALGGLGALREGSGSLASYLLFEPAFVQALVALGERDAYAHKDRLLAFCGAGAA
ncbi:patatin-like phospholipase family protein [Ramlibacter sp. USB13]|uniref:Patatin-like phospholipase family protein n=1 Tax=Ramlibacter cellulosilyticus TaxID=2764187 RepID=A0A923SD32_9BURK|nr:patatin-like phospholipase family protein [Ramlibacter cellulosilyticus]MBC5785575.1 patatin-like phospholipase family protein [Ramlibacter cellulosilyticus]